MHTAAEVRSRLCTALDLDLIGPGNDGPLANEVLDRRPFLLYLTGFLVPQSAEITQRQRPGADEDFDEAGERASSDEGEEPEKGAARHGRFSSSIGLSVIVEAECKELRVTARWGDYTAVEKHAGPTPAAPGPGVSTSYLWQRAPREAKVTVPVPARTTRPERHDLPGSDGLRIVVSVRPVPDTYGKGARAVSVFLVNERDPQPDELADQAFTFQAELELSSMLPLVARRDARSMSSDELDERIADLQYSDVAEYAVGHGVASSAELNAEQECHIARTAWIPRAAVERVEPRAIETCELAMEALAALRDGDDAQQKLIGLVELYRQWIEAASFPFGDLEKRRKETAENLLERAEHAAKRIEAGIQALRDPQVLDAFKIAMRCMARAYRQRKSATEGKRPEQIAPPKWRPFQLAFVLLNLHGIVDPTHPDRETVDLLFFPTGGGKTEAYLGLAAFALVLRRLKHPGIASAGVTVLMRYTLRLLTLDQLSRAATLICALELERQRDVTKLGDWPFEIGLWVGMAATPNKMGKKGDDDEHSARTKVKAYDDGKTNTPPIPLEDCPWCGTKLGRHPFRLLPNADFPIDLRIVCMNRECVWQRDQPLPIVTVDEPLYRRLPGFVIATVDKLAQLPWVGDVGALFGKVDRFDKHGFYGPCDQGRGAPLPQPLLPPDLIIQDELHLISGPLGTIAGLYEVAIDALCTRDREGKSVRPKIVASTATVRRAESQIKALFCRQTVDVFPPPGPSRNDSFFAHTVRESEQPARHYVGVAAQGRSLKVVLLRVYLALLGAAQREWNTAGGEQNAENPADPYMTLLGYFGSLRELGGARRIVEDEVSSRLEKYGGRKRHDEQQGLFANREMRKRETLELTSRVATSKVAEAKRRLGLSFAHDDRVDVALATNMISVGLDIERLGLMVVNGQPKASAEYIQATSRVGRRSDKPGLVVTLLNVHRPRDRSHYERFGFYHATFYRAVEAASVTPFSPRALDKALAAAVVGLARHGMRAMTAPNGALQIGEERARLAWIADLLAERATRCVELEGNERDALAQRVRDRVKDLLDAWEGIAHEKLEHGARLQFGKEEGGFGAPALLHDFLDRELANLPEKFTRFRANRSMRDVEPAVDLYLKSLDGKSVETEEGA